MSEFSDTLSLLIDRKKTKVYDLIRYLEMDRSTMYQIIRGKRNPPSDELIFRIADYMRLSPSEKEDLLKQAQITRLGKKLYYQRKGVEQFLCDFPEDLSSLWKKHSVIRNLDAEETHDLCSFLPTEADVNLCIQKTLHREAGKEKGHIALMVQPEENYLFNMLRSMEPVDSICLEQIICLSDEDEMADEESLLLIHYLNTILPFYVRSNIEYTAYYYYDRIGSHFFHNNGFSGMILTEDTGILLTSDYRQGMVLRQQETVSGMWKLYRSYLETCQPLFQVAVVDMQNFSQIQQANDTVTDKTACYILEREVCLLPLITRSILEKYCFLGIQGREMMVESLTKLLQGNREMLESMNMHLYFTREGLEYFAKTGKFKELPEGICMPLEKESRIMMLSDLKEYCARGIYKMLAGKMEHLAGNLRLCVNGGMGYLMFTEDTRRVIYMFLTEPGLLGMFKDYIENIEDKNFFPDEVTAEVIEKLCQDM